MTKEELQRESNSIDCATDILQYLIKQYPGIIPPTAIPTVFDEIQKLVRHHEYIKPRSWQWLRDWWSK